MGLDTIGEFVSFLIRTYMPRTTVSHKKGQKQTKEVNIIVDSSHHCILLQIPIVCIIIAIKVSKD